MKRLLLALALLLTLAPLLAAGQPPQTPPTAPVWQSEAYAIYPDRVVQGPHTARALSATELVSDYQSPANANADPLVVFKFSLNGLDNEAAPGRDHRFVALARPGQTGGVETPVLTFGQPGADPPPVPANTYLAPNTRLKIRLDMRAVQAAFAQQGYFTTYDGAKLYRQDFRGVYVAGNTAPLSWEFNNLPGKAGAQLTDPDNDGIYETTLTLNAPGAAPATAGHWQQTRNTADLPQYHSDYPLADALYNLALEEARRAVEPDSTFRTGKEWAGVWTRDISYSIILAQAALQPRVAMKSLLRKVQHGRIVQDTGTGGAYPVSSDRVIWAVAAWEVYKATGDLAWLRQVYPIVRQSLADDWQNLYDPATGLVRGESSFLDWREQTYPRWMQPADIYQSECLGTNAVQGQARTVAAEMAARLGDAPAAAHYRQQAATIRAGINGHLWQPGSGYYGQYLYGRLHPILSPRAEGLGEALAVLFGAADSARARQVVARTPTVPFGLPCLYPQIPGIPPYHNEAVWPFVQSFWALAGARAGNETSVAESMAAIYRPAALFLTNKENFVAGTGDFAGTQINSSNMLWSLSGSLALVYKVLFGMQPEADRLVFRPFVPQAWRGTRTLTNFRYRGAVLDVAMTGFGHVIRTITLDGQPLAGAAVPGSLSGRHRVQIVLANVLPAAQPVRRVANRVAPATPVLAFRPANVDGHNLLWAFDPDAAQYGIFRNGRLLAYTTDAGWSVRAPATDEYQVVAMSRDSLLSFASEPPNLALGSASQQLELEEVAPAAAPGSTGFSGTGYVETTPRKNPRLVLPLTVPAAGRYALDFRYANGNGPINTENKCAIRTLRDGGGQLLGTVVLPQRGPGEWSNWGFSNPVLLDLPSGPQTLTLTYEPANENMNGAVNEARLDYVRLRRVQ